MKTSHNHEPNEHDIQLAILERLEWHGIFCFRNNVGRLFIKDKWGKTRMFRAGVAGMPDISFFGPGYYGFIEVKTPKTKNKVSPAQQEFIDKINKLGGLAFVAWSVGQVEEELKCFIK